MHTQVLTMFNERYITLLFPYLKKPIPALLVGLPTEPSQYFCHTNSIDEKTVSQIGCLLRQ